jgi:hypothetical protein
MKDDDMSPTAPQASRSRALIAVKKPEPKRGLLATCARAILGIVTLPVRLPVLALLFAARCLGRLGAGVATAGRGLGRGAALVVTAPFVFGARLVAGLARLLARTLGGTARGIAWLGARAGRGIAFLLLLPVKAVVLLARLVALLGRLVARTLVFTLKLQVLAARRLVRGTLSTVRGMALVAIAIGVPAVALSWGAARYLSACLAATVLGLWLAIAFLGRLLGRGIALVGRGVFATLAALAIGIFVCLRMTLRIAFRLAILPFLAVRILAIALARGVRNGAVLLGEAARTIAAGLAVLARATVALVLLAARGIVGLARPVGAALRTREPQYAALLPLSTLAVLGLTEVLGASSFPFATLGLLLIAAFAYLAFLSASVNILAVLLAWALAVTTGWRAERITLETSAWFDALVYLTALAAVRSTYVAARAFVRESPAIPRAAVQERAHRRASRAIGIVLAAQCVAFAFWTAADGRLADAPLYGELLLVGAGLSLAWVVRTGQYVRTAEAVLTLGAIGALVGTIAAQFGAFGAGQIFTAASVGAAALLVLVTAALTIVVHTRLIDTEHGA